MIKVWRYKVRQAGGEAIIVRPESPNQENLQWAWD
jgi:hypothetical protein